MTAFRANIRSPPNSTEQSPIKPQPKPLANQTPRCQPMARAVAQTATHPFPPRPIQKGANLPAINQHSPDQITPITNNQTLATYRSFLALNCQYYPTKSLPAFSFQPDLQNGHYLSNSFPKSGNCFHFFRKLLLKYLVFLMVSAAKTALCSKLPKMEISEFSLSPLDSMHGRKI